MFIFINLGCLNSHMGDIWYFFQIFYNSNLIANFLHVYNIMSHVDITTPCMSTCLSRMLTCLIIKAHKGQKYASIQDNTIYDAIFKLSNMFHFEVKWCPWLLRIKMIVIYVVVSYQYSIFCIGQWDEVKVQKIPHTTPPTLHLNTG